MRKRWLSLGLCMAMILSQAALAMGEETAEAEVLLMDDEAAAEDAEDSESNGSTAVSDSEIRAIQDDFSEDNGKDFSLEEDEFWDELIEEDGSFAESTIETTEDRDGVILNEAEEEEVEEGKMFLAASGTLTISQLKAKFPAGKYWNHAGKPGSSNSYNNQDGYTSTPCPKHGTIGTSSQTCNGFQPGSTQLSWQCMGFAEKLGYDSTGYNPRNNANGWKTNSNVSALDSLKAGDIVRYKNDGHSIFVTAVNGDTVTYADCNSDGHCKIRWDQTISKSTLRSTFSYVRSCPKALGGEAPSNVSITIDHSKYQVGECVTFRFSSIGGTSYVIGIDDANGNRIHTNKTTVGEYTKSFFTPGDYSCYVSALNENGYMDSARIYFTVYNEKPQKSEISTDREIYKVGEEVTFHLSSDTAIYYVIGIDDANGNRVHTNKITAGEYTKSFFTPGDYSCYVSAYNNLGFLDSARIYFTIYDSKPTYAKVNVDKPICQTGEIIHFQCFSDTAIYYVIGIDDANGNRIDTNKITTGEYTKSFFTPGDYSCYVSAFNEKGYMDSARIYFTVYNENPKKSEISTDREIYKVGEEVTFHLSSDTAIYYVIGIDDANGNRIHTNKITAGEYTKSFFTPGNYSCYVSAYNNLGFLDSDRIYFTIYDSKPTYAKVNVDKPICQTGEIIHFQCFSDTAIYYVIGIDDANGNRIDTYNTDAGVDKYARSFSTPGKYSCFVKAYNNYGYTDSEKIYFSVDDPYHVWDSGIVTTKPTCIEPGIITYTCRFCGETKIEELAATGHQYDRGVVTRSATCTENGIKTYTCSACGKTYTETIKATGHNFTDKVTAPTCTARGYTTHTCSRCGVSNTDNYVNALGHSYDSGVITKAATDETDGVKTYTCSRCGNKKTEVIPATGHKYDSGKVTKAATCTQTGIKTYTCTECGKTYTEEIPATGHKYKTSVIAATCTKSGYTNHTCTVCGDSYKDTYISALGHSYDSGVILESPTCTEEGSKVYTCGVCHNQYTESVAPAGHKYNDTITAATCTKRGYTTHTCTVCHTSYRDTYTDARGHSYGPGEIVEEPICTEEGLKSYTCSVCQNSIQEPIPATGHTWDDGKISREATCTDVGTKVYTCTACQEQKTEEIPIDSEHHAGGTTIRNRKEPTDKEDGYTGDIYCEGCGQKLSDGTVIKHTASTQMEDIPAVQVTDPEGDPGDKTSVAGAEKEITAMIDTQEPAGSSFAAIQVKSSKQTKNSITISWNKVSDATGYIVYGNQCGKNKPFKRLAKQNGTSYTYKKLKKGTYYKFSVVAYKTVNGKETIVASGKTIHVATKGGKVTNVSKVKLSKSKVKLKKGGTVKVKATAVKQTSKLTLKTHRKIKFESSNKKVATVDKNGKIKAKGKGTCYIYAYSQNGVYSRVKVTVK